MQAAFCRESFQVRGSAVAVLVDGRVFQTSFPSALWRWLDGKDWLSVDVRDDDFGHSYGWDRLAFL